mgnify:CR=1 FL=1
MTFMGDWRQLKSQNSEGWHIMKAADKVRIYLILSAVYFSPSYSSQIFLNCYWILLPFLHILYQHLNLSLEICLLVYEGI